MTTSARRFPAILALAAAATIATGCTASAPEVVEETAPVVTLGPTPTPTRTPSIIEWVEFPAYDDEPSVSERGNVVKQPGEVAGLADANGEDLLRFMVQAISIEPECEGGDAAPVPENGYFVRVDLQGEALPGLTQAYQEGGVPPVLSFSDWSAIDSSGVNVNTDPVTESGIACLTRPEMIYYTDINPGERGVGSVVLDVPTEHGTLILRLGGQDGWEYTY
ncbi:MULTISPECIES: hypothetical protein [unclassified Microbacterium]|uniref:hypothetical protein n=1 Tax=unclassified Microbacterium TaxID=2609290 RepID=UPI001604C93B|nr:MULTISPECIES: hypothetical protein [unclassified Microbacterium]QNA92373.1 hypothetical protein G4G29_08290 [Microbacterium sp. Se63.02b]QYM65657.1 hypothetical protein K1X59_08335 [Microbacterium sp. Se5.02b]